MAEELINQWVKQSIKQISEWDGVSELRPVKLESEEKGCAIIAGPTNH